MTAPAPRYFEFGSFVIDSRRRILTRDGVESPISAKNFDLLLALVQNDGRIITHDELLDAVWGETFVEQSNLKKGISTLRQILGETPETSLYIKTVPRKGYSFVAPVTTRSDEAESRISLTEIVVEEEIVDYGDGVGTSDATPLLPAASNRWSSPVTYIAIGGLVILLVSLSYGLSTFLKKKTRRFSAETVKITRFTNDGNCTDASISSDGNFVLCGITTADGNGLMTRQVSANSQIQIVKPEKGVDFWAYRITPRGDFVYYILNDRNVGSRNGLYRISFLGGTPTKIAENASGHITFSPDGKNLAFVRIQDDTSKIVVADMDGSNERVLTEYGFGNRVWGLNWSPDGATLLCSVRRQIGEKFTGFVDDISVRDGKTVPVFPEQDRPVFSATWMPDKSSIVFTMRELNSEIRQVWQYFPASRELLRVTNDSNTYRFLVLNESGTVISTTQESNPNDIYIGDKTAKETRAINQSFGAFDSVSFTRDGRLICSSFEEGSQAVYVMNADGSNKRRLTDGRDGIGLSPRLSSDERSIIFASLRGGSKELWRIGLDGAGLTQLTRNDAETIFEGRLLSDNSTVLFFSQKRSENALWKQSAGGTREMLVRTNPTKWDLSADEKLLLYESFNVESKDWEVVIESLDTRQRVNAFKIKSDKVLRWTKGNSFVYSLRENGRTQIYEQNLDGSKPTLVYEYNGQLNENITGFDLSSDGHSFTMIRGRYLLDAVTIKVDGP